jgi:hypothetical protein
MQSCHLGICCQRRAGPSAQDPASPGNLFVGSGIPAENFGVARNETAGIELGLMVRYRQGPTIPSTDNYADGVLNFSVASRPQSTANGSIANNSGRAAWNFSVATGLNGATTDLNDYKIWHNTKGRAGEPVPPFLC